MENETADSVAPEEEDSKTSGNENHPSLGVATERERQSPGLEANVLDALSWNPTVEEADAYLRGEGIIKKCEVCGQDATLTNDFVAHLISRHSEVAAERNELRARVAELEGEQSVETALAESREMFPARSVRITHQWNEGSETDPRGAFVEVCVLADEENDWSAFSGSTLSEAMVAVRESRGNSND